MEIKKIDQEQHAKDHAFFGKLWRYSELAQYLQVSEDFLRHAVMSRSIPFIKIGRSVRFCPREIELHLKKLTTKPEGMQ